MSDRISARLVMALSGLVPFVIYLRTLAREITFTDAGELAAVASTLGIAHPPGYPLFTLLGRLFTLIPVGSAAFRVGLLSALSMASAAMLVHWSARRLLISSGLKSHTEFGALAGAWLFAFALTPWSQAVVVEVYGLQAVLTAALLATCVLLCESGGLRHLPLLGLLLGVSLTNHLSSSLLLLPAVLICTLLAALAGRGMPGANHPWIRSLPALLAPLTLYLYLPLRARQNPPVVWDYLESVERLFIHVSGRQYQGLLGSAGWRLEELRRFFSEQLPAEAGWILPVLGVVGLVTLLIKSWRFALTSVLAAAALLAYNAAYPIHDIRLYYIPVLLIIGLWAALGASLLAGLCARIHRVLGPLCALILILLALLPLRTHWRVNDQRDFDLVARYTKDLLKHLEPDAVLFSSFWDHFCSSAIYYQRVESVRPDVLVLDMGSLAHPSLERCIARVDPELAADCREDLARVRNNARSSERGQALDVDQARREFEMLQRRLVERAMKRHPVYMTSELRMKGQFVSWQHVPWGQALRLAPDQDFLAPPLLELTGPGLRFRDCRNDEERKVHEDYTRMRRLRKRYFERHDRPDPLAASLSGSK